MLVKILIALAVIVVVLIVIVALQPSDFRVTRSATMSAPAPAVFAQVNDFHKWEAWNPWGKIDPAMKQTDRKSTRLNSSHLGISYAVFCLKKKKNKNC